jgi:hypothetical protein
VSVVNLDDARIKKRRINNNDWVKVESYIKKELAKREADPFRKVHEMIWKEVDRQVYMKSPEKIQNDPKQKNDWHSAIELGELSEASETATGDVLRLAFPNTRAWFESHVELQPELDPSTGQNIAPQQEEQIFADGSLRALMTQQHADFGFMERVELSTKEALHHGGFVVEARNESAMLVHDGSGIQSLSAPVWVPHSMWNCYPDPSPSILGTNMLYMGSMIIKEYTPLYKLKDMAQSEDGWMGSQIDKVPKKRTKVKDVETDDVELVKYFGDLVINRTEGGDIFLPNSKVVLANGVIVFYAPNKYPFPNIIYSGYEKLDVRDPYYISPLMKLAPMHKVATVCANHYLNALALKTEPPSMYDGNDPDFVQNGGPTIAPGWKGATKGTPKWVQLETGDPQAALAGVEFALSQVRQGTSNGMETEPDQTATASRLQNIRGEVKIVKFVSRLEFSLKTFLYMQHEINKRELDVYTFYNPEMDAPDFMRVTAQDLPQNVHFEIVGSRGILGEQERAEKTSVVISFASQNPLFAPLLKGPEILKEMFQDAGVKSPERFLNIPNDEMQQMQQMMEQKYQGIIQEGMQEIDDLKKKLAIAQSVNDAKVVEAQIRGESQAAIAEYKAQIQKEIDYLKAQLDIAKEAAKQQGEVAKNVNQLSIKEIADVINSLQSLIDNNKASQEAQTKEVSHKVDTLMSTHEKLLTEIKKPVKLKDANGKVLKTASRD